MVRRTVLGAAVFVLLMLCGECFAAKNAANAQTRAQLDRVLPAVNFTNVTLKDAIDFLRDVSGSNIHVNWKAIEAAGITQDTPITRCTRWSIPCRICWWSRRHSLNHRSLICPMPTIVAARAVAVVVVVVAVVVAAAEAE